jgi:hypothetical protein
VIGCAALCCEARTLRRPLVQLRRVALACKSTADFADPTPDAGGDGVPSALRLPPVGEVCAMQERARTWRQEGLLSELLYAQQADTLSKIALLCSPDDPPTPRHRYMDQPCTTGAGCVRWRDKIFWVGE